MLITVRVFFRTAQTAMARQSIFSWQLLGEFRTPTLVKSLSASKTFQRAKMRRGGQGLRELPHCSHTAPTQLPARQVRMEEEEGVEEEEEEEEDSDNAEEEEEDLDHAEEGTFDPDFETLLGEILQVE